MNNYGKIIFIIKNRGWKNGKLLEFLSTSMEEINEKLVDKSTLKKLKEIEKQ
jgi:hypothetical protein